VTSLALEPHRHFFLACRILYIHTVNEDGCAAWRSPMKFIYRECYRPDPVLHLPAWIVAVWRWL